MIVSLARTPRAVDLMFLLLFPVADGGQLYALASVARKFRKSKMTAALRNASDGVELHHYRRRLTSPGRRRKGRAWVQFSELDFVIAEIGHVGRLPHLAALLAT